MPTKLSPLAVLVLYFAVLCIAAWPLLLGPVEFTGDDHLLLAEGVRGMTFGPGLLWDIWTRPTRFDFVPVTITTVAVEQFFWGADARLFHITNLLIAAGAGTAAWLLVKRILEESPAAASSKYLPAAALAATALMLLHPVNVESYASITQRRELLYAVFGLLSLRCYLDAGRDIRLAAGAYACAVIAQLSKETAIVLPALFLCAELVATGREGGRRRYALIAACAATAGLILFIQINAVGTGETGLAKNLPLAFGERLGGVVRTLNFAAGKLLFPIGLAYDYDLPRPSPFPTVQEWIVPVLLVGVPLVLAARRKRLLLMLVLLPLVAVAPYLNIFHFGQDLPGQMIFFDHYLLMPTLLVSALVGLVLFLIPGVNVPSAIAVIAVLSAGAALCDMYYYRFWRTRETVARRAIEISPQMPKGYFFLGVTYLNQGRYPEARKVFARLMTTKQWFPTFVEAYQFMGDSYAFSGDYSNGARFYQKYLRYKPDDQKTLQNLSTALIEGGQHVEAIKVVETLLRYYPGDQTGLRNRQRLREASAGIRMEKR